MASDEKQRRIFAFLQKQFTSNASFALQELQAASGYEQTSTFNTYLSKQFGSLVSQNDDGTFRVNDTFRKYSTWERFSDLVSQVRRTNAATYLQKEYPNPIIFEFFLPLANEVHLRDALDALFFRESMEARLRSKSIDELRTYWPGTHSNDDAYINELCIWLGEKLAGYSIGQVSGRYRIGSLKTKKEVHKLGEEGSKYLVDEITAVVRFIIPVESKYVPAMRFFFELLFVKSVTDVTDKEAEIWILESGAHSTLNIWSLKTS